MCTRGPVKGRLGDLQPPTPRPVLTLKNLHLQKEWENTPCFFMKKKKPWNTSATRKVRGVERRRDEGKNREEEGEFEKKNISESEKMA